MFTVVPSNNLPGITSLFKARAAKQKSDNLQFHKIPMGVKTAFWMTTILLGIKKMKTKGNATEDQYFFENFCTSLLSVCVLTGAKMPQLECLTLSRYFLTGRQAKIKIFT